MSLDRLINLAKKTGGRLIVHDSNTGEDVVIMGLGDYEHLVFNNRASEDDFSEDEALSVSDNTNDDFEFEDGLSNEESVGEGQAENDDRDGPEEINLGNEIIRSTIDWEDEDIKIADEAVSELAAEPVFYEEPL